MRRLYSSPVVHCPSLCPFGAPDRLFRDDYDPHREEASEKFCLSRPECRADETRPCVDVLRRLTAESERRDARSRVSGGSGSGPREGLVASPALLPGRGFVA